MVHLPSEVRQAILSRLDARELRRLALAGLGDAREAYAAKAAAKAARRRKKHGLGAGPLTAAEAELVAKLEYAARLVAARLAAAEIDAGLAAGYIDEGDIRLDENGMGEVNVHAPLVGGTVTLAAASYPHHWDGCAVWFFWRVLDDASDDPMADPMAVGASDDEDDDGEDFGDDLMTLTLLADCFVLHTKRRRRTERPWGPALRAALQAARRAIARSALPVVHARSNS